MRLKNKIAIVTGGGSGFGAGIVKKFIQEGAKVVVADINLENAKKVAMDTGGFAVEVDVSNSLSFKNMVDKTLEKFGKLAQYHTFLKFFEKALEKAKRQEPCPSVLACGLSNIHVLTLIFLSY